MNNITKAFNLTMAGDCGALQQMLASGEVQAAAARSDGMYRGYTLLHAAAMKGQSAAAALLLCAGAPARVTNANGKSPAQMASD